MIAVIGLGYVGASISVLLAKEIETVGVDIDPKKVKLLSDGMSPILDEGMQKALESDNLNLTAALFNDLDWSEVSHAVICTPTNYDVETGRFDTSSVVRSASKIIEKNGEITIFIKSTIPIGFTDTLKKKLQHWQIYFSPEFLREGFALHDNLYPSRIIVGGNDKHAHYFGQLLRKCSENPNCPVIYMDSKAAESVKLFSNTYLAMRVAFFNEIDSFCLEKGVSSKAVIEGMSLDPRIGLGYNNPSFGYGGYCLPKDTKQAIAEFEGVNQSLISATVKSNHYRKMAIVKHLISKKHSRIGVYRLIMKTGSDNFRSAAIWDIIKLLREEKKEVVIYEPLLEHQKIEGATIVKELSKLNEICDVIITNRLDDKIKEFSHKIFTRDLFNEN